ncbi:RNA polymerase III transcription factor IIIC subunit-domain-containing protein [Microdochium bolleyi]|uniref:RNA polymerase III transcription factor IIIC subunit-domain-containing protein n=1 Tax=Microdochium bolleyi TaxID=196109 RepID=A0A136J7W3_9PEZI|nr:RNA polymerase III transcription factor IIIC subunit-domain-containing protein [Microdochium bolleyi]
METEQQVAGEPLNAPRLPIPSTTIVAIEHPSPVYNLEAGLRSFGPAPKFDKPHALPLWFRPENPAAKPITSHHAASNNVLLKITVPRRTGRKRKRGTNDAFQEAPAAPPRASHVGRVASSNRLDRPSTILRRLQDNVGDYRLEAVGMIRDSHRFRGLADFQFANADNKFLVNVAEHLLPLDPTKYRKFKLRPGMTSKPGDDIIPPPHFTDRTVPFFYQYEQNPLVRIEGADEDGGPLFVNVQGKNILTYSHFIPTDHFPVPDKPRRLENDPMASLPVKDNVLRPIQEAFSERPIWTRRALNNRLRGLGVTENQMKIGIPLVGYQFRGGPWRDAVIKYGIDPRGDPKYRIYQTLQFKLVRNVVGQTKLPWQTIRKGQTKHYAADNVLSHLWDGESYSTDGKFWQICDVTDPFLKRMLDDAPVRPECDLTESGWYYKAFWTKVKLFMKAKMVAIKHGRMGSDNAGAEGAEPRRDNYIYNSYLEARLRNIPDDSDDKVNPLLNPLLYPMSDLKGIAGKGRQSKLFPDQHAARNGRDAASGFREGVFGASASAAGVHSSQAQEDTGSGGDEGGFTPSAEPADDEPDWDDEVASGGEDDDEEDDEDDAGDGVDVEPDLEAEEDDDGNEDDVRGRGRRANLDADEEEADDDDDDDGGGEEDNDDVDADEDTLDITMASHGDFRWAGNVREDHGGDQAGEDSDTAMRDR